MIRTGMKVGSLQKILMSTLPANACNAFCKLHNLSSDIVSIDSYHNNCNVDFWDAGFSVF